jgi:KaiC/GvpD/RAD55 family RecA-like ATPase
MRAHKKPATKSHNLEFARRQLRVLGLPRIPLIEDSAKGQVPVGSSLLVEFEGASQWYNASLSIAAGWVRTGGTLWYTTFAQSPEIVRSQLKRLGLDVDGLQKEDRLHVRDGYTCTLGQKSAEKYAYDSLKVSDLSIIVTTRWHGAPVSSHLGIADDYSCLARFNDEKSWVEFMLTRAIPDDRKENIIAIYGIMRGVHSQSAYDRLEGAATGVIDFKVDESGEEVRNAMRIRVMRNVGYDSRWHQLMIGENFEITLEK